MKTDEFVSLYYVRQELMRMKNARVAIPFQISFSTANRAKKTGGKLISIQKALLAKNQKGKEPLKHDPRVKTEIRTDRKYHSKNNFNVVCQETGNFFEIHYHLITYFQNKEVRPNKY